MRYDRSGFGLKALWLGRWSCLRQEVMTPGETISGAVMGAITFQALRAPIGIGLHVTMLTFFTPMRWLWSSWPDYVKQGVDGALSMPYSTWNPPDVDDPYFAWNSLGVGELLDGNTVPTVFVKNWNRCYNWWLK